MAYSIGYGDSYVTVNGIPYNRGDIMADRANYSAAGVTLFHKETGRHNPLINALPTEIENANTGLAFADFAAFDTFFKENFFFELGGGSGPVVSNSPYFTMAAPAAGVDFIQGYDLDIVKLQYVGICLDGIDNIAWYHEVDVYHTVATGRLDISQWFEGGEVPANSKIMLHGWYL